MTRILAIEPDLERGTLLRRLLRNSLRADVTVAPSTKAALTALSAHAPDLILTSSLIAPQDERDLVTHLRETPALRHLPVLTMPPVAEPTASQTRGLFARLRRQRPNAVAPAYDFSAVAARIEEAIMQSKTALAAAALEPPAVVVEQPEPEIIEASTAQPIVVCADVFAIRKRPMRWASWQLPWFSSINLPWTVDLRLINISRSGVLVESGARIAPGATMSFRIVGPGRDLTMPARIVRSEVAKVDRLGVKYHAAAVFDYAFETLMPEESEPFDSEAHLDVLVSSVLTHAEAGSRPADLRIEFEAGVRKIVTAREVRLRDVPMVEDNGCDSVYFSVAGANGPAVLQATFEPGYQPTADEFAALKAAAVAAGRVVSVTKTARQLTMRTTASKITSPLHLVPHAPASALELRPTA
ncbi:MAG TPA: PilZ domain-containing protein [Vicinamibacterales bacterium]|jgi:CheY-like chemotaxis protein